MEACIAPDSQPLTSKRPFLKCLPLAAFHPLGDPVSGEPDDLPNRAVELHVLRSERISPTSRIRPWLENSLPCKRLIGNRGSRRRRDGRLVCPSSASLICTTNRLAVLHLCVCCGTRFVKSFLMTFFIITSHHFWSPGLDVTVHLYLIIACPWPFFNLL